MGKARTFLDFQIAKTSYKNKLELKLNVQNVLVQDLIFYQNKKSLNGSHEPFVSGIANTVFTDHIHNEQGFDPAVDDVIWKKNWANNVINTFL